jgi:hypothetical protein
MTSEQVALVLKLYPTCPMMLTENKDVCNGQANGSQVCLKKLQVKMRKQQMIVELL